MYSLIFSHLDSWLEVISAILTLLEWKNIYAFTSFNYFLSTNAFKISVLHELWATRYSAGSTEKMKNQNTKLWLFWSLLVFTKPLGGAKETNSFWHENKQLLKPFFFFFPRMRETAVAAIYIEDMTEITYSNKQSYLAALRGLQKKGQMPLYVLLWLSLKGESLKWENR